MTREDAVFLASYAEWYRCRSLNERKSQTQWSDLSQTMKNAWAVGANNVLDAIGFDELADKAWRYDDLCQ